MNLIVDEGNTNIKMAVFNGRTLIWQQKLEPEDFPEEVKKVFKKYTAIEFAIVSSVGSFNKKFIAVLSVFAEVHMLSHASKIPFKNSYATPSTLGMDRIALATAAFYHNPDANTLVIDAGTCITYDVVNDYGEYLGGAISPGLRMRYTALHRQTSKLPWLEPDDFIDIIGNSTEACIHSGVINGICNEIDGVIAQYKSRFEDLTVILTGGDTQILSKRLKNTIFAHSNFLLEGLNYLLDYNKR
ncbi:type III pantothenate kinase [uncultured Eudoraea sp.]|uniref:type III pantothenate kinase n=1 Tax=uncultured Eudoraea sp. TaxID=1035614 RepID=UPI0026378E84|nr:type III pantothenate kinase [uncultured Eudoraea sp.]